MNNYLRLQIRSSVSTKNKTEHNNMFQAHEKKMFQKDVSQLNHKLQQSDTNLENVHKALQRKEAEYNQLLKANQERCLMLERQNNGLKRKADDIQQILDSRDQKGILNDFLHKNQQLQRQHDELLKKYSLLQSSTSKKNLNSNEDEDYKSYKNSASIRDLKAGFSQRRFTDIQVENIEEEKDTYFYESRSPKLVVEQSSIQKDLEIRLKNSMTINKELEEQLKLASSGDNNKEKQLYVFRETIKQQADQISSNESEVKKLRQQIGVHEANDSQKLSELGGLTKQLGNKQQEMQVEIDRVNEEKVKLLDDKNLQLAQIFDEKQAIILQFQTYKEQYQIIEINQQNQIKVEVSGTTSDACESHDKLLQKQESDIKHLKEENIQTEKLCNKQIQILNKKIMDLQELLSKKALEVQRTRGSRRTSQLQTDHLSISMEQKDLKIQQLSKNLIETKQSYETILDKAKQMSEKNKMLKDKMSKAHKLIKKEDVLAEGEQQPEGEVPATQFVWDLVVTNEQENLSSLTQSGWEFAKCSAVPMKPYIRKIFVFSLDSLLLTSLVNNYFDSYFTEKIKSSDLSTQQAYVRIVGDTCVMAKVMSSSLVPSMTLHKKTLTVYDQLDKQLWDEIWIDYAQNQADCLIICIKEFNHSEEEIVNSLIRMNPPNLIIQVSKTSRQQIILDYLSQKFSFVKHTMDDITYYSNNRISLIAEESTQFMIMQMNRAKNVEEKLFLDSFKQFLIQNSPQLFNDQSKPKIKISKLIASNTFNYLVQSKNNQINQTRVPIILNTMAPIVQINIKDNNCQLKIQLKDKIINKAECIIKVLSSHSKIQLSQITLEMSYKDEEFQNFLQHVSYVTQIPLVLESTNKIECLGNSCTIFATIHQPDQVV